MKLLIGFGNEMRGDDGLGPRLVRAVAGWKAPDLEIVDAHQLTPELAERIVAAEAVLFIDAVRKQPGIRMRRLQPATENRDPHILNPEGLLGLAQALSRNHPPAWLLTIPGDRFGFSTELSEAGKKRLEEALPWVRTWLLAGAAYQPEGKIEAETELGTGD
ncbi:MAG: hydrogenase maturation protease [Gemmataceae bacterium]